jgi:hypothetical protein
MMSTENGTTEQREYADRVAGRISERTLDSKLAYDADEGNVVLDCRGERPAKIPVDLFFNDVNPNAGCSPGWRGILSHGDNGPTDAEIVATLTKGTRYDLEVLLEQYLFDYHMEWFEYFVTAQAGSESKLNVFRWRRRDRLARILSKDVIDEIEERVRERIHRYINDDDVEWLFYNASYQEHHDYIALTQHYASGGLEREELKFGVSAIRKTAEQRRAE